MKMKIGRLEIKWRKKEKLSLKGMVENLAIQVENQQNAIKDIVKILERLTKNGNK